jgi:hypothetical protein
MQPRAKTLQERFGFQDKELSTPRHDELMMWLDENIEACLRSLLDQTELTESDIRPQYSKGVKWEEENLTKYRKGQPLPPVPDCEHQLRFQIKKKVWEQPLSSGNFIVGFVDMFCVLERFVPKVSMPHYS